MPEKDPIPNQPKTLLEALRSAKTVDGAVVVLNRAIAALFARSTEPSEVLRIARVTGVGVEYVDIDPKKRIPDYTDALRELTTADQLQTALGSFLMQRAAAGESSYAEALAAVADAFEPLSTEVFLERWEVENGVWR